MSFVNFERNNYFESIQSVTGGRNVVEREENMICGRNTILTKKRASLERKNVMRVCFYSPARVFASHRRQDKYPLCFSPFPAWAHPERTETCHCRVYHCLCLSHQHVHVPAYIPACFFTTSLNFASAISARSEPESIIPVLLPPRRDKEYLEEWGRPADKHIRNLCGCAELAYSPFVLSPRCIHSTLVDNEYVSMFTKRKHTIAPMCICLNIFPGR